MYIYLLIIARSCNNYTCRLDIYKRSKINYGDLIAIDLLI